MYTIILSRYGVSLHRIWGLVLRNLEARLGLDSSRNTARIDTRAVVAASARTQPRISRYVNQCVHYSLVSVVMSSARDMVLYGG